MPRFYYETKKPIRWFLRATDAVVDACCLLFPSRKLVDKPASEPVRVLVLSMGHLGDTLVLSYVLPLIRQRYPGAEIDVVAGSWCDPIWLRNPHLRRVVHVDHLICNRRPFPFWKKVFIHWKTSLRAIRLLRNEVYDFSLDIRYADPPSHFLQPFLRIRKRIGMGTRRLGGLLDAEFFVPERGSTFHHVAVSIPLFQELGLTTSLETLEPTFYFRRTDRQALANKLGIDLADRPFMLLCPETGMEEKNMPVAFWQRILDDLMGETDWSVVLCGQQARSSGLFASQELTGFRHRLIDAVGKLTIEDMATLAEQARLAITLDSFPAHLCGIFCPLLAFYKQNGTGYEFFPIGNRPIVVIHDHRKSANVPLPRPNFEALYVEELNTPKTFSLTFRKIRELGKQLSSL